MAAPNAAKNAGEAAAKAAPTRAAGKFNDITPKSAADLSPAAREQLLTRANELGYDTVQTFELDYKLIPELEAAGLKSEIKTILASEDPYSAAKMLIQDERASLAESLKNSGLPRESLDSLNLRDLKNTAKDLAAGPRPSNIRGKDKEATDVVESRLPAETTAQTPSPDLDAAAATEKADAVRNRGRIAYSDGATTSGPGFFTDTVAVPAMFRSDVISSSGIQRPIDASITPAPPPTPSMRELQAQLAGGGKKGKKGKSAEGAAVTLDPDRAQVVLPEVQSPPMMGDAFYADPGLPVGSQRVGVVESRTPAGTAASPSVQPAPPPEVSPPPEVPPPKGPSIADTDIGLRAGKKLGGTIKHVGNNHWPTALTVGSLLGAGAAYRMGLFGSGSSSPQPSQQPSGTPIYILPRETLQDMERRSAPRPPAQQPPPAGRPAEGQSTDIIRQLSGRMA